MIAEIQEYLKTVIMRATDVPEHCIFTEARDAEEFKNPPWISIMPRPASLTNAWHKDNYFRNSSVVVIRKYNVVQPIGIYLEFEGKQELSDTVDNILAALPKQFIIKDGAADIAPQRVEFFLTKGSMDRSGAIFELDISYAVREDKEIKDKINKINFNTNKK